MKSVGIYSMKNFMQNLAPVPVTNRKQIPLTGFDWRIETHEDLSNFAVTLRGKGNCKKEMFQ